MINLAAMQLLAKYPKLANLSDMLSLKANQLNRSHFDRLADALNVSVPFSGEVQEAFLQLLRGKDINYVADLIQSPESVAELVTFAASGVQGLLKSKAAASLEFSEDADSLFIK